MRLNLRLNLRLNVRPNLHRSLLLKPRSNVLRSAAIALCTVFLAGCASAPVAPAPPTLFADEKFAPPAERINAADVFALSDAMRAYLRTDLEGALRSRGSLQALVAALYKKTDLQLEYDSAITRNAAQAFEARAGNCLSLAIMTAAFANALGLHVNFQSALFEETWSRAANLYLMSGHVNIALNRRSTDLNAGYGNDGVMIDFLPQREIRGLRTHTIGQHTVIAMYMNNRAAEALVQGQVNQAYWWAREAIAHDPNFYSAVNTLGVIYRRHGDLQRAEFAFNHILAREPSNAPALANLVQVLADAGRLDESRAIALRLAKAEPNPPFHFFNLGRAAMLRGDYAAARDLFAKEVRRADYYHEFHFWLAVANFNLGELEPARKHLALAMQNSTTRGERDMYAAKLAALRARVHRAASTR